MKKRYIYLLFSFLLSAGFSACSDNDGQDGAAEVFQDEKAYANFFAYNMMNDVYLWKEHIRPVLESWKIMADPVEEVANARYRNGAGEEVDKWTLMTAEFTKMQESTQGVSSGTYGWGIRGVKYVNYGNTICAHVLYTYPGSPAEKAGLKRGDMILEINGKPITDESYRELSGGASVQVRLGSFRDGEFVADGRTVGLQGVAMYEDPVLVHKVFDCGGGKKVGYLMYTSFTLESCRTLLDVCRAFKAEGISELILDLRYNGGGYVFTEEVLASMLAPEAAVKGGSVYQTEIWNDDYMSLYREDGVDLNTYFRTSFSMSYGDTKMELDTSDANLGIGKIYALVTGSSASASESILVGLMPYMDIEVIGARTHGKYCTGLMQGGEEWFREVEKAYRESRKDFAREHPQFADWDRYIADWGIYVMINMYADKDGNNPCMPGGLEPGVEVADAYMESYPLGDEREAMLNAALHRAGKSDLVSRSVSRSLSPLPSGDVLRFPKHPLDGKRISTAHRMRPRVFL